MEEEVRKLIYYYDVPRKSLNNPNALTREIGTNSEICINIVTINFNLNKIFITKIGAGEDLVIDIK